MADTSGREKYPVAESVKQRNNTNTTMEGDAHAT